jgi:hypothetical protein
MGSVVGIIYKNIIFVEVRFSVLHRSNKAAYRMNKAKIACLILYHIVALRRIVYIRNLDVILIRSRVVLYYLCGALIIHHALLFALVIMG